MYTISPLQAEHADACKQILITAYKNDPHNENISEENAKEYVNNLIKKGNKDYCSIATIDNIIVGAIFTSTTCWSEGAQATIEECIVLPAYQQKGVGSALLTHTKTMLKNNGISHLALWTKTAPHLLSWYKKQGFNVINDFCMMHQTL